MRVHVKNFQSLSDASLDVEGLTVLVGPSDLGKSALVRAIDGALFNRPGDYFVRTGASNAEVTLTGVPTIDPSKTLDVVWVKGRKNTFEVNGEKFDKVGSSAPAPLQAAGYRDVGAEEVRPQVAGQFDRLFLLDRPGSVVASILTALSRVMVVSTADRLCSSDVKSTKRIEVVRRVDLAKATADVEATAAIDGLHDRVSTMRRHAVAADVLSVKLRDMRERLVKRRAAQEWLRLAALPDVVVVPDLSAQAETANTLTGLVARRRAVQASGWLDVTFPDLTPDGALLGGAVTLAGTVRDLLARRALAAPAAAVVLPVVSVDVARLDASAAVSAMAIETLRRLVPERAGLIRQLRLAESTAHAASGEAQTALEQFELAMAASPTCALCGSVVA